jgi:hypothetical protein
VRARHEATRRRVALSPSKGSPPGLDDMGSWHLFLALNPAGWPQRPCPAGRLFATGPQQLLDSCPCRVAHFCAVPIIVNSWLFRPPQTERVRGCEWLQLFLVTPIKSITWAERA